MQLFSKKPMPTLADMKAAKLYTSKGDDKMVQWYMAERLPSSGAHASRHPGAAEAHHRHDRRRADPPYPALLLQIFRDAKYMLDVRFAPL